MQFNTETSFSTSSPLGSFTGSGGIAAMGCARNSYTPYYITPYLIGDLLYVTAQAYKGILNSVVIKKIELLPREKYGIAFRYIDTFNCTWFYDELCTRDLASPIALEANNKEAFHDALTCKSRQSPFKWHSKYSQ